jgi:hypothetical protein
LKIVKNATIFCSKSGKITNHFINEWFKVIINSDQNLSESEKVDILLLLDLNTAHWNEGFKTCNKNKSVKIHTKKISESIIDKCEPLEFY